MRNFPGEGIWVYSLFKGSLVLGSRRDYRTLVYVVNQRGKEEKIVGWQGEEKSRSIMCEEEKEDSH